MACRHLDKRPFIFSGRSSEKGLCISTDVLLEATRVWEQTLLLAMALKDRIFHENPAQVCLRVEFVTFYPPMGILLTLIFHRCTIYLLKFVKAALRKNSHLYPIFTNLKLISCDNALTIRLSAAGFYASFMTLHNHLSFLLLRVLDCSFFVVPFLSP